MGDLGALRRSREQSDGDHSGHGADDVVERWRHERPDLDALALGIYERLARLSGEARRAVDALCDRHGLRRREFEVLVVLRSHGPDFARTPTDLAHALMMSPAGITDRIDSLVTQGWVERVPDQDDRRRLRVALTPEGRTLVDAALTDHAATQGHCLNALTPTEQHTLDKLLRKLLGG